MQRSVFCYLLAFMEMAMQRILSTTLREEIIKKYHVRKKIAEFIFADETQIRKKFLRHFFKFFISVKFNFTFQSLKATCFIKSIFYYYKPCCD